MLKILVLSLFVSTSVFAAGTSTKVSKGNVTSESTSTAVVKKSIIPQALVGKAAVAVFYASTDSFSSGGVTSNSLDLGWEKYTTTSGLGVKFILQDQINNKNVDWYSAFSAEQSHELKAISYSGLNGSANLTENPNFKPFVLSAGLVMKPSERFYIPVGINYSPAVIANYGIFADMRFNGDMGWEAALGLKSGSDLGVELGWRELKYKLTASTRSGTPLNYGQVAFGGMTVTGRYNF